MKTVAKLIHELATMPQEGTVNSHSKGLEIRFQGKTHWVYLPFHRSEDSDHGCEGFHQLRPLTEYELADPWMSVSACCDLCGDNFGWRCKVSPDGICHYHNEEGKFYSLRGDEIVPPEGWKDVDQEDCVFCRQPSERK
jgi:hypothetical protein